MCIYIYICVCIYTCVSLPSPQIACEALPAACHQNPAAAGTRMIYLNICCLCFYTGQEPRTAFWNTFMCDAEYSGPQTLEAPPCLLPPWRLSPDASFPCEKIIQSPKPRFSSSLPSRGMETIIPQYTTHHKRLALRCSCLSWIYSAYTHTKGSLGLWQSSHRLNRPPWHRIPQPRVRCKVGPRMDKAPDHCECGKRGELLRRLPLLILQQIPCGVICERCLGPLIQAVVIVRLRLILPGSHSFPRLHRNQALQSKSV